MQTDSIDTTSTVSMTDMSMHYIEALEQESVRVVSCIMCTVRECLEDSLSSDDQKVRFYTGLTSFAVLISVFNLVSSVYSHTNKIALSKFEEFIVIFMKLRLSLFDQNLAHQFGVSQPLISRIFH